MQSKSHKEGKETSENKNVQISNKLNNRPLQQLAGFRQEATAAVNGIEGKQCSIAVSKASTGLCGSSRCCLCISKSCPDLGETLSFADDVAIAVIQGIKRILDGSVDADTLQERAALLLDSGILEALKP